MTTGRVSSGVMIFTIKVMELARKEVVSDRSKSIQQIEINSDKAKIYFNFFLKENCHV